LSPESPAEAWRAYKTRSFALLELVPGDQVLDVGCGTGEDALALGRCLAGVSVVGVDLDPAKIREALARSLGVPRPVAFQVGDACRLPFEEASFDAVRADKVLHHLDDPGHAVAEMVRVTRPGGRVVVSDVDYDTLVVEAPDQALTRRILHHHADRMPSGTVGRRLSAWLREAGLRQVRVHPDVAVVTEDDEDVLKLREKAEHARDAGVVSEAEAAQWVASLAEAGRLGRFFCALTIFTVRGRRP
jgi:ubiquinone/menaquinone biosynthesis C-methylase UbiE